MLCLNLAAPVSSAEIGSKQFGWKGDAEGQGEEPLMVMGVLWLKMGGKDVDVVAQPGYSCVIR